MVCPHLPRSLRGEVMERMTPAAWLSSLGLTLSPSYAELLYWVLDRIPTDARNILDVGYGWGASTVLWLQHIPDASVVTVDPLPPGGYAGARPTFDLEPEQMARWRFVLGKLENVAELTGLPFDFIFLDADHAYDSTVAQLAVCWDLLKPGGLLAGHDCYSFPEGVGRAVSEFAGYWNLPVEYTQLDAGAWLIRKPPETDYPTEGWTASNE